MRNISFISSLVLTATALSAQCVAPGSVSLNSNPPDFSATHYVGSPNPPVVPDPGHSSLWDMTVNGPIVINSIDTYLDDYTGTPNPAQDGNTGPFDLWICPTTHTGNELIPANWVLVGSGTYTVDPAGGHSPCVFSVPVAFTQGTYGVALNMKCSTGGTGAGAPNVGLRLHPLVTLPSVAPNTPLTSSDQFITITNEVTQRVAFTSGIGANHTINVQLNYQLGAGAAFSSQYGSGCYFRPQSFYESFPATAPIDLSNQGFTMINNGTNYTVIPGAPMTPFTPVSAPLVGVGGVTIMGDDDQTAPITLPFTFSSPGGRSTTQIVVGSNGYVFLTGTPGSNFGFYDDVNRFLTDTPRIAVGFGDWQPADPASAGTTGNIYYDVDPSNTFVTITWDNVSEWNAVTAKLNAQVVLWATGQVDLKYGACSQGAAPVLTGYSCADGNNPGASNFGAVPYSTGDGSLPSRVKTDVRPVLGTTFNIVTENISAGTFIVMTALSFVNPPPPPFNDLAGFGMPGCVLNVGLPVTSFFSFSGGAPTSSLAIAAPNLPSFINVNVRAQSAPLTPGLNAAGIVTSNGLCINLGL